MMRNEKGTHTLFEHWVCADVLRNSGRSAIAQLRIRGCVPVHVMHAMNID